VWDRFVHQRTYEIGGPVHAPLHRSEYRQNIPDAVATYGVSDRVAFLRRTYAVLGVALIAWAALTAAMMRFATEASLKLSQWALGGRWSWLVVLVLFMLIGVAAQKLALSNASRGLQYAGLALFVVAESLILQPLLWLVMARFGGATADAYALIGQAAAITLAIFVGLTATVFITKKDFSFLRGILTIGMFAVIGIILASILFGFSLGAVFCGAVVLLMAGYILFQTSIIMKEFPPTYHVAAALMLFSTIATLFWYVLQFLMATRRH
jgi:FtsH-binding integral membrane protein